MNYESARESWIPIGRRLAELRGESSQLEMSRLLDISNSTYSRLERGAREVGADVLTRLEALGWNATWVLTGRGPSRSASPAPAESGTAVSALDAGQLAVAIELADEVVGTQWLPTGFYAQLVSALYQAVVAGQPWHDLHAQAQTLLAGLLRSARSQ
ncbi:helix-turn-helix transcriptional regulator [Stenotrophomonas sp. C3(2023)]|nr:helix-turn-helix transcriptional regulator [Stenotrophomonas sp. C3(2023)]MDV3470167.1 helix-turn-helix transcriptional regulator [Stenotrophomonas sp. C3(2023)]